MRLLPTRALRTPRGKEKISTGCVRRAAKLLGDPEKSGAKVCVPSRENLVPPEAPVPDRWELPFWALAAAPPPPDPPR